MLTADQLFRRIRAAKRLADVAQLEGPVWEQAGTDTRPAMADLETFTVACDPARLDRAVRIQLPTFNGQPVIHRPSGEAHYRPVVFCLN